MKLKKNFRIIQQSIQDLNSELEVENINQEISIDKEEQEEESQKEEQIYSGNEEEPKDFIDQYLKQTPREMSKATLERSVPSKNSWDRKEETEQKTTSYKEKSFDKTESSQLSEFKDDFSVEEPEEFEEESASAGDLKHESDLEKSLENNSESCISNYKDLTIRGDPKVHSFEDCEIFLRNIIKIVGKLARPLMGEAFESVLPSRSRGPRGRSGKKVVIKKRTLRGTELEKINFRNKSFSG